MLRKCHGSFRLVVVGGVGVGVGVVVVGGVVVVVADVVIGGVVVVVGGGGAGSLDNFSVTTTGH